MKIEIDIEAILAPIPGDNPAGEDLRYSPVYDQLKEVRRADDLLDRGDWRCEVKTSDWDTVITIAVDALINKTKDLQIAAWLVEALIKIEGFDGFATGLKILTGLLKDYWEHLYPELEDGDIDFRVAPIEFVNDKLWPCIKQVSITDSSTTPGYSWLKWQESRQVGFEANTRNRYGDVDENKKKTRNELIAEGKLTAEDFDSAVALSSKAFYESLAESLSICHEEFKKLDGMVDEKFGSEAPRLAEIRSTLDDCKMVIKKIVKDKKESEPDSEPEPQVEAVAVPPQKENKSEEEESQPSPSSEKEALIAAVPFPASGLPDLNFSEKAMWENALTTLKTVGMKKALEQLFGASCSAPSVREKNQYRLLMAKLCLKAERPDLARPIVEKLYALIEELKLERWESPVWIAELIDTLYQCLTSGEPSNDDISRAKILLQKLCTTDVTKAISYRN